MESSGGSGGTGGDSSSKSSSSSVISRLYSHQVPIQSTMNPAKVIKKYGIFQFEEDATTTPWHVSSPLNLETATHTLPKFKENLPRFSRNNIFTTNEHLVEFSNACHNIGSSDNDTCMRLFVNSLEGKAVADFFDLPPKILSTWEELVYWFKSTYEKSKIPAKQLREYNNISYKDGETIKSFNLHFTRLYNPSMNSFDLRTKMLSCIIIMHYLPPIIIGLRKRPLITSVPLCILVYSMKNNLKEQVFLRETQLNIHTCMPS
jgi:hypothetical protein